MAGKKNDWELIDTGTDKRFVRRDDEGNSRNQTTWEDRSQQDGRQVAKKEVRAGQGESR